MDEVITVVVWVLGVFVGCSMGLVLITKLSYWAIDKKERRIPSDSGSAVNAVGGSS